jgi:PAS domain S-box-containing protein
MPRNGNTQVMSQPRKRRPRTRSSEAGIALAGEKNGLFESAFHNSPAMQSVVRASDGVIIEVNTTFLQKMRRTREQVIGKTPLEIGSWVEPERLYEYRDEFESKGQVQGFEACLRASDGRIVTVLLSSHPVKIDGVLHYLNAGVDITDRKQTEAELRLANERLRQSEERFSKAFRANPVTMAITRYAEGTFVAVNESLLKVIGYSESEVLGRTAEELNLYKNQDERQEFVRQVAEQGFEHNREICIRARNGGVRTLLVSAEPRQTRPPHLRTPPPHPPPTHNPKIQQTQKLRSRRTPSRQPQRLQRPRRPRHPHPIRSLGRRRNPRPPLALFPTNHQPPRRWVPTPFAPFKPRGDRGLDFEFRNSCHCSSTTRSRQPRRQNRRTPRRKVSIFPPSPARGDILVAPHLPTFPQPR